MPALSRRAFLQMAASIAATSALDCGVPKNPEWAVTGRWDVLQTLNMVPIHAALMKTGAVLFFSLDMTEGVNNDVFNDMDRAQSAVFDPRSGKATNVLWRNPRNVFCAGQCFLPDGRLLVVGGHAFPGVTLKGGADKEVHTFDPAKSEWTRLERMPTARWYPTCTALEDGRVLIVSGYSRGVPPNVTAFIGFPPDAIERILPGIYDKAPINGTYEVFDPQTDQRSAPGHFLAPNEQTLYPFVKLLPGGTLFVHSKHLSRLFFPDSSAGPLRKRDSGKVYKNSLSQNYRSYPGQGACVLLPLISNEPRARVLIAGGADESKLYVDHEVQATNTAEVFGFNPALAPSQEQSGWKAIDSMKNRRFMSDAVLLPDLSVLVTGGSAWGRADDNHTPVLEPERLDTRTMTWSRLARQTVPRRYHSVALLLPDGRVLSAGSTGSFPHDGNPFYPRRPSTEPEFRVEVFSPPYLFRGQRPVITEAPTSIRYGQTISVAFSRADYLNSIVLIRPGAVTHTNDMDQRCLRLWVEKQSPGNVTVRAPIDGTWAPPGWYMLFVSNLNDVPSIAHFVHLT